MKTDAEYAAWLRSDDKYPVALYNFTVDSDGVELPLKLSNRHYSGAAYMAAIERGLVISQKITPEGQARLAAGAVSIGNLERDLDGWLNYVWSNRPVEVLVGDERWPLEDFRVEFKGYVEDCVASDDEQSLIVTIIDRMKQLDAPLSDATLADGTLVPVALGECPNVTPKYDAVSGKWVYHAGPSAGLVAGEARVEGRPRTNVTQDLANGCFAFLTDVKGAVTCSVWGDATGGTYRNTIAPLVRLIATAYGKDAGRFTDADIDLANFNAFDSDHTQSVGRYVAERENSAATIAALASSVQAQLLPSRLGLLQLIQWRKPTSSTLAIRPADYVTIKRGTPLPVVAAVNLGYCRNWTPQQPQASIPDAHRAMFEKQWRQKRAKRDPIATRYRLPLDTAQIDTCFNDGADTQTEAERRADAESVKRVPYTIDAFPQALQWAIGQDVTLYDDRYMPNGKVGQVTMLEVDFDTLHVQTEVTV